MSVLTPPLPLSVKELKDSRTKGLNHLVTLLVSALASYNPQGILEAISAFIQYFTLLLEVIEILTDLNNNTTDLKGPHNI